MWNELEGNIWEFRDKCYDPIIITTNGDLNSRGENVMGKGIALQAKNRCEWLPKQIGEHIKRFGNVVGYFENYNIFSFPTKNSWRDKYSSLDLIEQSTKQLIKAVDYLKFPLVYLVRPGCSNGNLEWNDVKPIFNEYLDGRFIVISNSN